MREGKEKKGKVWLTCKKEASGVNPAPLQRRPLDKNWAKKKEERKP